MIWHYMGDELFLKCSREFIARWAGKLPTPYDLFYTFENISGQDLGWIWKPWFFEFGFADVMIESFSNNTLILSMAGNLPLPLVIEVNYQDGTSNTLYESIGVWSDGKKTYSVSIPEHTKVSKIIVNRNLPDADRRNNVYQIK
jgi:aminopeptidase N